MIPGWERDIMHRSDNSKNIHLVGLCNCNADDQPTVIGSPCDYHPISNLMLLEQMHALNQFVVLAHPVWSRLEPSEILELDGIDAIEVFNTGSECLCHCGHSEVYWDLMSRNNLRVWGIARDDTHQKSARDDRFGVWVMVNASQKCEKDIMGNLHIGNYYSTQGPLIYDWGIDGQTIYLRCSPVKEIFVITYPPRGCVIDLDDGKDGYIEYQLKIGETYIRIEVRDQHGKTAWTNPHFFD